MEQRYGTLAHAARNRVMVLPRASASGRTTLDEGHGGHEYKPGRTTIPAIHQAQASLSTETVCMVPCPVSKAVMLARVVSAMLRRASSVKKPW